MTALEIILVFVAVMIIQAVVVTMLGVWQIKRTLKQMQATIDRLLGHSHGGPYG